MSGAAAVELNPHPFGVDHTASGEATTPHADTHYTTVESTSDKAGPTSGGPRALATFPTDRSRNGHVQQPAQRYSVPGSGDVPKRRGRRPSIVDGSSLTTTRDDEDKTALLPFQAQVLLLGRLCKVFYHRFLGLTMLVGLVLGLTGLAMITDEAFTTGRGEDGIALFLKYGTSLLPGDASTSALQFVLTANCLVPVAVAALLRHMAPPQMLAAPHKRRMSARDTRVALKLWAIATVLVAVSLVIGWFVNKTDFAQQNRLVFCALIYVFNVTILAAVRIASSKLDSSRNDVTRFGTLFPIQVVATIVNSIGSLFLNFFLSGWRWNIETAQQRADYISSLQMAGMEGFVFLWISTLASQGLRFAGDLFLLFVQRCVPDESAKKFLSHLSVESLYGARETYALIVLQVFYFVGIGWTNPWIYWLSAMLMVGVILATAVRQELFVGSDYNGTPSLAPYLIPNMLQALPIGLPLMYILLLRPLGAHLTWTACSCIVALLCAFSIYWLLSKTSVDEDLSNVDCGVDQTVCLVAAQRDMHKVTSQSVVNFFSSNYEINAGTLLQQAAKAGSQTALVGGDTAPDEEQALAG